LINGFGEFSEAAMTAFVKALDPSRATK